MKFWIIAALVLFAGCGPSVESLRTQFVKEKEKLGLREKALLEFDRFRADLDGQERIQKASVERVEKSLAGEAADPQAQKYKDDQHYVELEREKIAEADHITAQTRAKLIAEIEAQRKRVDEAEAKLKAAQR
jgi:hypothetical protein